MGTSQTAGNLNVPLWLHTPVYPAHVPCYYRVLEKAGKLLYLKSPLIACIGANARRYMWENDVNIRGEILEEFIISQNLLMWELPQLLFLGEHRHV